MKIGNKIYFDTLSGDVIMVIGERKGYVIETTLEDDITTFKTLSERNRETFDYIQLEYGQYAQDFMECNGYRVNPETKQLEFSYPDPNTTEPQEPVYQKPLSEKLIDLEIRTTEYLLDHEYRLSLVELGL